MLILHLEVLLNGLTTGSYGVGAVISWIHDLSAVHVEVVGSHVESYQVALAALLVRGHVLRGGFSHHLAPILVGLESG